MGAAPPARHPGELITSRPPPAQPGSRTGACACKRLGRPQTGSMRTRHGRNVMTRSPFSPHSVMARRTILKGAGLGAGAGLVGGLAAIAQAQTTGAGLEPAGDGPIWSAEYWAKKGDVALNLWRKRASAPRAGEPPLPVLFLVHGSS